MENPGLVPLCTLIALSPQISHAQTSSTSDSSVTKNSSVTSHYSFTTNTSDYSFTKDTSEPIPDFIFARHINNAILSITANKSHAQTSFTSDIADTSDSLVTSDYSFTNDSPDVYLL